MSKEDNKQDHEHSKAIGSARLIVSKEDLPMFAKLSGQIDDLIIANKKVPHSLFKKMMDLLVPVGFDVDTYVANHFTKIVEHCYMHFDNDKDYEFYYMDKAGKNYFFMEMLYECLMTLIEKKISSSPTAKESLNICYESLYRYKQNLNPKYKKFMSHYKLSTVAAYVIYTCGDTDLSTDVKQAFEEKREPTHPELYSAVKYQTKLIEAALIKQVKR